MSEVIRTKGLVKHYKAREHHAGRWSALKDLINPKYRTVEAIKGLDLVLERGEALGIVGPNGAGKSTLVKLVCGVLVPTAGEVEVLGMTPHRDRSRLAYRLGAMFGQRSQLWWDLPVIDTLRLHQAMYDVSEQRFQEQLNRFEDLLELNALLNKAVRQLSLGQRTRAELALCLLHEPELLFLDEPTIGLDVMVKERLREFLTVVNRDLGTTILLTSHDMTDIEEICRRVVIIDEGQAIIDGPLDVVKRRHVHERVVKVTLSAAAPLPRWDDVVVIKSDGLVHTLSFLPEELPVERLVSRIAATLPIADIALEDIGIESVIKRLVGDQSVEGSLGE